MPFFAKDWRSPGEAWIKTDDGWEKQKILECRMNNPSTNSSRAIDNNKENCSVDNHRALQQLQAAAAAGYVPPYCQITLRCTKEVAGFNGLSDALRRLDFRSAVHDERRFPYTAKLLELLLSQRRITTLSGCAQKSVLNVLEEIAVQAQESQQNGHVLSKLLSDLRRIVRGDSWWGQPLGSSHLWGQHVQTIDRIDAIASTIQTASAQSPEDEQKKKFEDLPEECVREILFRLADHRDLLAAAEAYDIAHKVSAEKRLWKRLCRFHFSPHQINFILDEMAKQREKNAHNNHFNKNSNRSSRTLHPYLNNTNNNSNNNSNYVSRQNSVRSCDSNESTDHKPWTQQLLENSCGRVSSAFHDHLNRHRDNLMTQQQQQQHQQQQQQQQQENGDELGNSRFTSFQDVRNHFDQRPSDTETAENSFQQRNIFCSRNNNDDNDTVESKCNQTDWEDVYHRLRRVFGLREDYAETLHLCRTCDCLFWKSYGHPCLNDNEDSSSSHRGRILKNNGGYSQPESFYVPVPPQAFLKFFSL